ncbi:MAG: DUF167 domain-containing protein [bacterium]
MDFEHPELTAADGGWAFYIHVVPGASANRVSGMRGSALKIRIASPPKGGRANRECINFLSEILGVKKNQIQIVSGETSRHKKILVSGIEKAKLERKLAELVCKN